MDVVMDEVIPEGYTSVVNALTRAIESGAHVIITVGGTGIRTKNQTQKLPLSLFRLDLRDLNNKSWFVGVRIPHWLVFLVDS